MYKPPKSTFHWLGIWFLSFNRDSSMPIFFYELSKCKNVNWINTSVDLQKHTSFLKNCSWHTVSKYKVFTFSFFRWCFLLSRNQLRSICLSTARQTFPSAMVQQGKNTRSYVTVDVRLFFFPFFSFSFFFKKSTFPCEFYPVLKCCSRSNSCWNTVVSGSIAEAWAKCSF